MRDKNIVNNESTEPGQTTTQEMREQLEWDRLQNEALAAQRWRLEQEMQQAQTEKQPAPGDSDDKPSTTESLRWNKLAAPALAILVMLTIAVVVTVVWW